MKIAMLSDFHLGYERFREDAKAQAEAALGMAHDVADVLIIPGDIFDSRAPRPEVLAEAINIFRELSKKEWMARVESFEGDGRAYTDAPIIAIPGTHERGAQSIEDPVDLLGLAGFVVDISQATVVVQKDGERVAVTGIGGISEERFRDEVARIDPKPVPGAFNIFMFHQSVYELLPFSQDFIKTEELPGGFDLYVNGHIHGRWEGKAHGKPFLISGSTVLTQLRSGEQESKGFYVYDTKSRSYEYKSIKSRRFVHTRVEIGGLSPADAEARIRKRIEEATGGRSDRPIIKIELKGRLGKGFRSVDMDTAGLAKEYANSAIVEITKAGAEEIAAVQTAQKGLAFDEVTIKDYGLTIFAGRLQENKYDLPVNAAELFEMLSADASKEKVVRSVIEMLFKD